MKCHYIYTDKGEKILIPGCMAVAVSGDMENCTCRNHHTESFTQYEKKKYNEEICRLHQEIKELESENAYLNRIIRKLTKKSIHSKKRTVI